MEGVLTKESPCYTSKLILSGASTRESLKLGLLEWELPSAFGRAIRLASDEARTQRPRRIWALVFRYGIIRMKKKKDSTPAAGVIAGAAIHF